MENLDQGLRAILTRLVHDLKNPLAAIASNLHYLREEIQDATLLEAVQDCALSLERANRMLDDSVDMLRMRAGAYELSFEEVPLLELTASLRSVLEPQLGRRTLEIDVPPASLRTDRALLSRALLSLLEHGIRHTPGPRVVRLQGRREKGLLLEVIDGGAPFFDEYPPSILQEELRVREPVQSAWRSDQGLALTFVGTAIRALGGTVAVGRREDGQPGQVFRFSFPEEQVA